MRIIAGRWRGRKLKSVPGRGTRPMLDRVRESLFSVIATRIGEARVWDLFAGTGSLGLEALSRGAAVCQFVEKGRAALGVLRDNLESCREPDVPFFGQVVSGDAWQPSIRGEGQPDLVFLDPPYPQVRGVSTQLNERLQFLVGQLAPGGLIMFHYDALEPPAETAMAGLEKEVRIWGNSAVALISAREDISS